MSDSVNGDGAGERVNEHRRRFLQGVGATGIAGITAGCLGDGDENGTGNGDDNGGGNGDPEPASFEVTDLVPGETSVTIGDTIDVSATVSNTGDAEGTQTVQLTVDGEERDSADVTLAGGSDETVSFEDVATASLSPGDYEYDVSSDDDSASATLTVENVEAESLFSFDADALRVGPGENTVSGSVANSFAVPVESGELSMELPEGWEIVDESGASFDLDAGDSQDVEATLAVPEDAEGEYELTVEESYTVAGENASFTTTATAAAVQPLSTPLAFNFGSEADSLVVKDGVPFTPELPDSIAILGDLGMSVHDEEVAETDDDDLYVSEHHGANGSDLGYDIPLENGVYRLTFYFAETWEDNQDPDDTRVMDISVNDELVFEEYSAVQEVGYATAVRETVTAQVTDGSLRIYGEPVSDYVAYNGLKIERAEHEVAYVEDGGVAEESAFTLLPEGSQLSNESGDPPAGPDDLSAEFYFGYDEDNLYLRGEVSDDSHHAIEGEGMWEADSIQYAAGYDGTYGPEDGLSHVGGQTSTHRWMDGENAAGLDQVDADTSRNPGQNLTTYEATIPWEAILPEAPAPGDAFRFGVIVNEDDDGEGREAVLNWTQPAINADKEYGALGTFVLEDPDAPDVEATSAPYGLNVGGEPDDPQSELPVEIDGLEFVPAGDPTAIDFVTVTHGPTPDWASDWFEPPAGTSLTGAAIEGTDHDALYQTEFHGPDLGFDIAIENGVYDVTIHNAEVSDSLEEGDRIFDLSVQGRTIVEEFDVAAEVGHNTAHTLTVENVVVRNETLSISSTTHEDLTKFCGIEVREANSEPISAPYGLNAGGEPADHDASEGEAHSDVPVVVDGVEFVGEADASSIDNVEVFYDEEGEHAGEDYFTPPAGAAGTASEISGTDDDALYQTEFWGPSIGFDVSIENGTYDVTLHFAEQTQEAEGDRVFDVAVQGEEVLSEFDIYAEAGMNAAVTRTVDNVEVDDQSLVIETTTHEDASQICGIEIRHTPVEPSDEGLLGHWSFDDESIDGDTVVDRSENGHDGTIQGDVTTTDAPVGSAGVFDGSESTVVVSHEDDLNPPEFTVSLWVRSDGTGAWSAPLGKDQSMWCGLLEETPYPRLDPHDGDDLQSNVPVLDGNWHHVVYRHAPSEGETSIHTDGQVAGSRESLGESATSDADLAIGSKSGTSDFFEGEIADVRLYARGLSYGEIAGLYEEGSN